MEWLPRGTGVRIVVVGSKPRTDISWTFTTSLIGRQSLSRHGRRHLSRVLASARYLMICSPSPFQIFPMSVGFVYFLCVSLCSYGGTRLLTSGKQGRCVTELPRSPVAVSGSTCRPRWWLEFAEGIISACCFWGLSTRCGTESMERQKDFDWECCAQNGHRYLRFVKGRHGFVSF